MQQPISKSKLWTGRVMSWIVILFMLMDGVGKLAKPEAVIKGTLDLGYAEHHIAIMGIIGLIATVLYAIGRTSVLGAILLTAYFGGAIASNMRLDNPLFSHILFPVYLGILMWGGLWLRNEKLQQLIPLKK